MTDQLALEAAVCGVTGPGQEETCTARSAVDAVTGCVHEHIQIGPICQTHLEELAHGFLTCGECNICADPHRCRIEVISLKDLP